MRERSPSEQATPELGDGELNKQHKSQHCSLPWGCAFWIQGPSKPPTATLSPGCYGAEEPHFSQMTIHHSSIPTLEDKGTFSLHTGLSPASGTAEAVDCELERSPKTFRNVCYTSGAFPESPIRGTHIQHHKLLSTISRSGSHMSPCMGSTQPGRRAHAPAIAADSLAKAFCCIFHLQPPSLPILCSSPAQKLAHCFHKSGSCQHQRVPRHLCSLQDGILG